jgi:hypothetical protein
MKRAEQSPVKVSHFRPNVEDVQPAHPGALIPGRHVKLPVVTDGHLTGEYVVIPHDSSAFGRHPSTRP